MSGWLRFWILHIKIGHSYWKHRHMWTVQAYLNHTSQTVGGLSAMATAYLSQLGELDESKPAPSLAEEVGSWLADQEGESQ